MADRDPKVTKEKILVAAKAEFADKGIAGARVDTIAAQAGVNKQMIYYYFGSKEDLYYEVLRQRLSSTEDLDTRLKVDDPDRLAKRHDRAAADPENNRLLVWEALDFERTLAIGDQENRVALHKEWIRRIKLAQREGRLPADFDAAQLLLSELALFIFPFAFPQITWLVTGRTPDDPRFINERRKMLAKLGQLLTSPG